MASTNFGRPLIFFLFFFFHPVISKLDSMVKSACKPSGHQARAYPGFLSMKRLGVFLLPTGWDASPSQGYR